MFYGFIFTLLKVITSSFPFLSCAEISLSSLKTNRFCSAENILIVSAGFLIASADTIRLSADALIVFFGR